MAETQYWLFQANPKIFQLKEALGAEVVTSFAVTAHAKRLQLGDRIILWETGRMAGVYALGTIVSEVGDFEVSLAEKAFFQAVPAHSKRVRIDVDYNLWNKPITKEILPTGRAFESFYAGLPGTNFQATKAQYEALVAAIEQLDSVEEPSAVYTPRAIISPLNQILYGPPGTGKTYQTVNHALSVIERRSLSELALEERSVLRTRYETYLADGQIQFVSFHQAFSYEDFVEGIKPKTVDGQVLYAIEDGIFKRIAQAAETAWEQGKRYVLIIDELNRGNVASIFGELITLLEADKRLGAREALQVQLPYSKTTFSIPPNLYLIATMNTADRGIEALDIALRRRFSFKAVLPDATILERQSVEAGVDLARLLQTINRRITMLLSEEYAIGHAYFYDISTLEELRILFSLKIIPLLQEYFLGNLAKIGLILGNTMVEERRLGDESLLADFEYEIVHELLNKKGYQLTNTANWTEKSFIRIYNQDYY